MIMSLHKSFCLCNVYRTNCELNGDYCSPMTYNSSILISIPGLVDLVILETLGTLIFRVLEGQAWL